MNLVTAMRLLYSLEINCGISCFWDGGWDVRLGDASNGYKAWTCVHDPEEAGEWLVTQAKIHFPGCFK